jgi:hypothetical protein
VDDSEHPLHGRNRGAEPSRDRIEGFAEIPGLVDPIDQMAPDEPFAGSRVARSSCARR